MCYVIFSLCAEVVVLLVIGLVTVSIGCVCFCFQAEDGIRDLVRSRGLGDVYKRQASACLTRLFTFSAAWSTLVPMSNVTWVCTTPLEAVSYTHLTLPTSDLV